MTVYSGRYGSVGGQTQVLNWNIESVMSDNAHANSATRAGKQRDEGVHDWTGTVNVDGPIQVSSLFLPFTFTGNTGAPTITGNGLRLTGNAMWTSIAISGDITNGSRVTVNASFGGHGPLLHNQESSASSDVASTIIMSKDCTVEWNGQEIDWQQFNFTITNEVQTYVGSSTVIDGFVWTQRYPGLVDCSGSVTLKGSEVLATQGDLATLEIKKGSYIIFKITYARYLSTSGIGANPNTGELVGYTGNFGMCAHSEPGALENATLGSITLFDNVIWSESASAT